MKQSAYGYKINDIVSTVMVVYRENGESLPVGSLLRIVAITPKVRVYNKAQLELLQWPELDSRAYFYNAIPAEQTNDYENRIRANFCTIKEIKVNKS